jgi:hypothetical protein
LPAPAPVAAAFSLSRKIRSAKNATRRNGIAPLLPGVARRFPFSAALRPRDKVFFQHRERVNGEIAK